MKIKPVFLTIFSAIALSGMGAVNADTTTTVSEDGFLELTATAAPATNEAATAAVVTAKPEKVVKRAKPKKSARTKRIERQKRLERKKRAAAKRVKTYRVRSGDTLTKISKKTGVSVSRLVRLNRLYGSKKNHIEVGQRLRVR